MLSKEINEACSMIKTSGYTVAFTGAGISVESGIPPFRGENGLWEKVNPKYFDIDYFLSEPSQSWKVIKEVFYNYFGTAKPNFAHIGLSKLEQNNLLKSIITQNIDNLHYEAGNKDVIEFHGNSKYLVCLNCNKKYDFSPQLIEKVPPICSSCSNVLKPDFVFFGEPIPERASKRSFIEAEKCNIMIVIGSTGEVQPACILPQVAKENNAKIIEINIKESRFTNNVTDLFLQGKASEIFHLICEQLTI